MRNRFVLPLLLLSIFFIACKSDKETKSSPPSNAVSLLPKVHDRSDILVRYPDNWTLRDHSPNSETIEVGPRNDDPNPLPFLIGSPLWNAVIIYKNVAFKKNQSLEDLLQDRLDTRKKTDASRLIGNPTPIRLGKAKCFAYRHEGWRGACQTFDSKNQRQPCIRLEVNAVCQDGEGIIYEFLGDTGGYIEAGKPTKEVLDTSKTIEAVLQSLEFKR